MELTGGEPLLQRNAPRLMQRLCDEGFTVLLEGRDRTTGIIDVDAAEAYFKASSPLAPPPSGRVIGLGN